MELQINQKGKNHYSVFQIQMKEIQTNEPSVSRRKTDQYRECSSYTKGRPTAMFQVLSAVCHMMYMAFVLRNLGAEKE